MTQRGQKRRAEETEEQRNRGLSDMTQRGQEKKAEETDEQRNSRLSGTAQRSQERRALENRRTKEWPIGCGVFHWKRFPLCNFCIPLCLTERVVGVFAAAGSRAVGLLEAVRPSWC
ncbi:hypothetical protein AVEN_251651-1 [Araneus ventricosus]|uniref:STPR domain-containing protein n=1 Tax=Araneus ventricosus TaxID=182803 RepID=A0A4Y2W0D8_ARAVE|nr:hypothetical protein AVEN_251651-1 [Araneus ventricosus]